MEGRWGEEMTVRSDDDLSSSADPPTLDLDEGISTSTTYERVHAAMLRDIIGGSIKPGDRLKTAELAERYRVSQMPIREAIQRLQGEGLVTLTPNSGARVRSFDTKFIANLYELRAELHAFAHRDLFLRWDPDLPDRLTKIQERYEHFLQLSDADSCQLANIDFHAEMTTRCANAEVMRVLRSQERLVRTLRSALGYTDKRLAEQSHEHWLLIHAIRRRDMVQSMSVVRMHVLNAGSDVIALFESVRAGERVKPSGAGIA
jgi:DNA-binding GntR family transcriptional regulator